MEFGEYIHTLTKRLVNENKFNLISQINRATDSID